jgi:hypothetical protein
MAPAASAFAPHRSLAPSSREIGRLDLIQETEQQAQWGGVYSIYSFLGQPDPSIPESRSRLASAAAGADAVELELAATAVFLAQAGYADPWAETARRKPEKAEKIRMDSAKGFYRNIAAIETPVRLPQIG